MVMQWRAEEARHEIAAALGLGSLDFTCPTCAVRACRDHCRWCGFEVDAVVCHAESCPRVTGVYEVKGGPLVCGRCDAVMVPAVEGSGTGAFLIASAGPVESVCVGCAAMAAFDG